MCILFIYMYMYTYKNILGPLKVPGRSKMPIAMSIPSAQSVASR